jgi:hypothetical protein
VEEIGHFFSKIHIKSTVDSINKEIVLFFRVSNWLSAVKNSEIIINFPRKRYHLENTFLENLSHCYGQDGLHRFCVFGRHEPAKFRLLSQFFLNFGNINLFVKLLLTKFKTYKVPKTFKITQSPRTFFFIVECKIFFPGL